MTMFKFTKCQEQWLQALESGEYKQTQEYLCRGDSFCCLGVAMELFSTDEKIYTSTGIGMWIYNRGGVEREESGELTPQVKNVLGLIGTQGWIVHTNKEGASSRVGEYDSLGGANDGGCTFAEIADFIRKNPRAVFKSGDEMV